VQLAVHTLGCKLNQSETSAIGSQFRESGFDVVELREGGDVVFINSCTVTETADQECRKLVRRALRKNPRAFVIVAGCYAQLQPEEVASIEGVDLVLGTSEKHRAMELAGDFQKRDTPFIAVGDIATATTIGVGHTDSGDDRTRAFLKVQDGCDYTCSFCTIPLARGPSRSLPVEDVVRQARNLVWKGFREIVLTGVNVGDYGTKRDSSFHALLQALHTVEGLDRLKISSIEPNLLTDEIIALAATSDRLMPHFHIPLQSGSDTTLRQMRRRYKSALYRDRVETILQALPSAAIGVDVITGFPGESEAHFLETVHFLEDLPIAYLHVFTYSERANTPATDMAAPVPREERTRRTHVLRELSVKKRAAFHAAQAGETRNVLVEKVLPEGRLTGLTDHYVRVVFDGEPSLQGAIVPVVLGEGSGERVEGWIASDQGCMLGA